MKRGKVAGGGKAARGSDELPPLPPLPSTPTFARFVDFARRIISVPRSEIEKQERLYREERKRRAARSPSADD
jgi:hypothetical protein